MFSHSLGRVPTSRHPVAYRPKAGKVIGKRGPWCHLEAVEFATLEWVDWFNHRRLLEPIGDIPPAELEEVYYRQSEESAMAA